MELKQSQPNNFAHQSKKAYHAPGLTALGTVEQLTQGGSSGGAEGFSGSGAT